MASSLKFNNKTRFKRLSPTATKIVDYAATIYISSDVMQTSLIQRKTVFFLTELDLISLLAERTTFSQTSFTASRLAKHHTAATAQHNSLRMAKDSGAVVGWVRFASIT
jgi:hypothetical protein